MDHDDRPGRHRPRRSAAARIVRLSAGTLGAVAVVALGSRMRQCLRRRRSTPAASVSRNAAETTTVDEPPALSTAPTSTAAPATVDGADTAPRLAGRPGCPHRRRRPLSLDAADTATRQATDALNTDNEGTIP